MLYILNYPRFHRYLKKEINDNYSLDMSIGLETIPDTIPDTIDTIPDTNREDFFEKNMMQALLTQSELKNRLQISLTSVKRVMKALQENGKIEHMGSSRKGYWKIT